MNKHVLVEMWLVLKEMFKGIKYGVLEELDKVIVLVQISVPILLYYCFMNFWQLLLCSILCYAFVQYLKRLNSKLNETSCDGVPIPEKQYVEVDSHGFLSLSSEDDLPSMIQYVYKIEKYLKGRGLM